MTTRVIKRDCSEVDFDPAKIEKAILKSMKYGSGIVNERLAHEIAIDFKPEKTVLDIEDIENYVYDALCEHGETITAKCYEAYRAVRAYQRETNTIDNKVLGIIHGSDRNTLDENSNKQSELISTQRDLVAEEVSKDIALRMMLPPHLAQAHQEGLIHIHDLGHYLNPSINCCLVNLKDMLDNGTVINGKMIESPHSFRTACTIATQIIAQVASGQFGGQSASIAHLSPYVRKSKEKITKELIDEWTNCGYEWTQEDLDRTVTGRLKKEIKDGIQTLQYQINTLQTSNGRLLPL